MSLPRPNDEVIHEGMTMGFPTADKTFNFEQATVTYRAIHSAATGKVMPKLHVQAIDQYGYQREFTVQFTYAPGDSKDLYWEYKIYQHPGMRNGAKCSQAVAVKFIERFLYLCESYPTLLFNETDTRRPRAVGFVHLATTLYRGVPLSVRLIK